MAKKIEVFEGRPVFQASNSKQLAEAVARYEGEVEPPYVVRLPDEATEVKAYAFDGDSTVGEALLPESVTSIGDAAFLGCTSLSSINLPDSVTKIGDSAFAQCKSLSSIAIPSSVKTIGECAFALCTILSRLEMQNYEAEFGEDALEGCPCKKDTESKILEFQEEKKRKAKEEAKRKAKEEAERKAKAAAERKAIEESTFYNVYIDKINDKIHAMMTARSMFGWGSADFRTSTATLPLKASTVKGKSKADEMLSQLQKGGFACHIEAASE